jgi:acyl-CoA synthetase (NDP forming)
VNDQGRRVFDALFAPRAIALIGASSDARKHTSRPQRTLRRHGYAGTIIPINPNRTNVFGDRAYPSLRDVPLDVDHAFIMVPAAAVAEAVEQCVTREVPVATIYTDGFSETGTEGRRRQEELVALAARGPVRLLGPNCSGIYSSRPPCALSVNAAIEQLTISPGPLAVVSQSGSMTGGLISRGLSRGVGFSRVVSVGNECDLTVGELTDWLIDDDETGAILLFLESIRDAPRLASAARRAVASGKPIIAYKLGRSDVGRTLAASHTGALAGGDDVADAFFRENGILRVTNLEALFELAALVIGQRPAQRHRVAVMSTTGGGAATVVDGLGSVGVDVVPPSQDVIDRLAAKNIAITDAPLTDLTHAGTMADVYGAVVAELLASEHCDLVLAVAGSSAQFQPEITVGRLIDAQRHDKPLAVFLAPHAPEALLQLTEAGVAGFRTPEACVDSILAWARWINPVEHDHADAPEGLLTDGLRAVAAILAEGDGRPNEHESSAAFASLGIRVAPSQVIRGSPELIDLAYPVAAKVLSADVPHKTDAGGVVLGIPDVASLNSAVDGILTSVRRKHPEASVDGILVQEMVSGLVEVILGFRRDPEVGPIVVLGTGGVLAEIYRDVAIRLAPVSRAQARSMIDEVRGLAVIRGYRGLPLGDCDALIDAIVAMSYLSELDGVAVAEAEINPLLVREDGNGVVAVDGLIIPERRV